MKGILRTTSLSGVKRRLSFAPGVKEPEEELPPLPPLPPQPPNLDVISSGNEPSVPGVEPISVAEPSAIPVVPAVPIVAQTGEVLVVRDDDTWPATVAPLLVCAAVVIFLALIAIVFSYDPWTSSGAPTPLNTFPTESDEVVNSSIQEGAVSTVSLVTFGPATKDDGRQGEYEDDLAVSTDHLERRTDGFSEIWGDSEDFITWDNSPTNSPVEDMTVGDVDFDGPRILTNDSEENPVPGRANLRDPSTEHASTRNTTDKDYDDKRRGASVTEPSTGTT